MRPAPSEESSESEAEDDDRGLFQRLFNPETEDTSSGGSSDDGSDSSTLSGSSDLSDDMSSGESLEEQDEQQLRFDKELRAHHRAACKSMSSGKYGKAIKAFEGILADLLDRFGDEHHRVGAALHNVAVANLRAGKLSDARDAIEEGIRIRKVALGDSSSKVADSLVEYGIILLSMKKYDESLEAFENAYDLRKIEAEATGEPENSQEAQLKMAKIKHNIGCVNFELGSLEAAKEAYTEAIVQQKKAFGSWSTPFMIMTDTTKPGFLTMASTMCNKGYIDLEQEQYTEAINTFKDSLKIQKVLLEADNKLILSTLDNVGYSYCMMLNYEHASKIYEELVKLQQESYGEQAQKGWSQSVKKLVYCLIKLYRFEPAFDHLRLLEEYLSSRSVKTKSVAKDLQKAHELMGEVNYQIFKFPTLTEYASRAVGCGVCTDDRDAVQAEDWFPKKPSNGSKMSGHRMTYA